MIRGGRDHGGEEGDRLWETYRTSLQNSGASFLFACLSLGSSTHYLFWQWCYVPGDLVVVAEGERDILGGVASLLIALLLLLEFALWIKVVWRGLKTQAHIFEGGGEGTLGGKWKRSYGGPMSPKHVHMTHCQMFQKVESDLPAKIWRLVGYTEMISW